MEYEELLLKPEVWAVTRLSDSTIWRLERKGKFPRRFTIGEQKVAWLASEVRNWLQEQRTAGVRLSGGPALIASKDVQGRRVARRSAATKRTGQPPPRTAQAKQQGRTRV